MFRDTCESLLYAAVLSVVPALARAAVAIPSPLTLHDAQRLAVARSPLLAESRAEIEASRNSAEYHSQLPDPELTLGAQNLPANTLALDQSGMSMLGVGLSQKFPPPGKLGLIHRQLKRDTGVLRYQRLNLEAGVVRAVRRAWLALYYDERALKNIRQNRALYRQMEQVVLSRYRSGGGQATDILRAHLASGRLIDQEDELRSRCREAQSHLAQLLDLPSYRHITLARTFPRLPAVPPLPVLLKDLVHHPVVIAQDDAIRAAQLGADAARRDFYPSYEISAGWAHRAAPGVRSPNVVSVGVSLSLPLFPGRRQDARLQRGMAQTQIARYRRDDLLLNLRRQAQSRYADYDAVR
ncbi:MAG: TolC family protein, partial [Acidiferrobacteraceae bacterium]